MTELMLAPRPPEQQQRIAPVEGLERTAKQARIEGLFTANQFDSAVYYECAEIMFALRGGKVEDKKRISDPTPIGNGAELIVELYDSNGRDGSVPYHSATYIERTQSGDSVLAVIKREWPRNKDAGSSSEQAYIKGQLLGSSLMENAFPLDTMIPVSVPIHSTLTPESARKFCRSAYDKVLQAV